ncbi:MAG: WGR domain-containing protein [Armatimonadota bacterium]
MTATATAAGKGVVKEARYVLTNLSANNNKFWNIRLYGDGTCETHWGRVGESGQRKTAAGFSESAFDSKCREKQGKGYQAQKTIGNAASGTDLASEKLAEVATRQIETDSEETLKLVTYLARVNVHRILQATTLQYDETTGTFSTPLGVLTADAITEARTLLGEIGGFVQRRAWDSADFVSKLNAYFMLVPQNIGRGKPDPAKLFPDTESVQKQSGILDSLEASLQTVLTKAQEVKAADPEPVFPKLFEAKLFLVEDAKEIARIRKKYAATRQSMHACQHLEVKRVFRVEIGSMRRAFEERGKHVGKVQEFWHGTRAGNLLSILKTGFVIPPASASYCSGRMFGNGVYFSDQSTKSLNYAYGYWSGGKRDENCYMLLCDVAMGRSYTPKSYTEKLPLAGYDSTFARAGHSGVANNEMIVYNTDQINPRYLIEFGPTSGS